MSNQQRGNQTVLAGVVGIFDKPQPLVDATRKVREANYESFDVFTPYPIHGLEKVQGLKRSWLPYVTLGAGLTGFMCAVALQYYTSVVDWPINVAGKPLWSWPAFVPIFFELTILFAGLATVAAMFIANGLPNQKSRSFDASITRDKFAIMIDAPRLKSKEDLEDMDTQDLDKYNARLAKFRRFDEEEAKALLKSLGAVEVRSVEEKGWF